MNTQQWLERQKQLYAKLPKVNPVLATHPISGQWQQSQYLKNQFWWGGGASQEAFEQLAFSQDNQLNQVGVVTFGPVQSFLGSGQRLRDWAVASWLCHYLSAVFIYRWQEKGGKILLPLHHSSPLVSWLQGDSVNEMFWRAELPNVFTGIFPNQEGWLADCKKIITQEWTRFLKSLEKASIAHNSQWLNGIGWRVIHGDNQYLWSVYGEGTAIRPQHLIEDIDQLHRVIEGQKLGRQWQGKWWGGKTSPSAGSFSVWHPGLQPVDQGGTWGLPDQTLNSWWEGAAEYSNLSGLFSKSDRLNSLEMVKRLASVPEIIVPTLEDLWGRRPPDCPWGRFPDRTAVAATWVVDAVPPSIWNDHVEILNDFYFEGQPLRPWGIPQIDQQSVRYAHPRVLERRNISQDYLDDWQGNVPSGWESTVEWTVGWRGDGDRMGQWLSGQQYEQLQLPWSQWHPSPEQLEAYNLGIEPPDVPSVPRQIELPHMLDLSVLLKQWNELLYELTEQDHKGKVIFAGGDDFLLLGSLSAAVSLTTDLHTLWTGQPNPLTEPLNPPIDGWVKYQDEVYPVPGELMNFSLGVVIAQRRIPQSLWHRGLNEAYKTAKNRGRDRVCVTVLFNNGQSLQWVCPWKFWNLLMLVQPVSSDKTALNCWEKLLAYLESTRLQEDSPATVRKLIDTLWASVGLPLRWEQIEAVVESTGSRLSFRQEIGDWQWWLDWISLRAFLARQEREREQWRERVMEASQ